LPFTLRVGLDVPRTTVGLDVPRTTVGLDVLRTTVGLDVLRTTVGLRAPHDGRLTATTSARRTNGLRDLH